MIYDLGIYPEFNLEVPIPNYDHLTKTSNLKAKDFQKFDHGFDFLISGSEFDFEN